jgi:hypothetical protein
MKCIFCLEEKPSSDEHVIPESVGGNIHLKEVCIGCNGELSRLVDAPFANSPVIELARHNHSIGGKRNKVPFPFRDVGVTESGLRVGVNRDFENHVKRDFKVIIDENGGAEVYFVADASDVGNYEKMLGKPLRKELVNIFPDWSPEQVEAQVNAVVSLAKTQKPVSENSPIKFQWRLSMDDLLFEFLKIAYEMWFRRFGYSWVESSQTALMLRKAILGRDKSFPIKGQFGESFELPGSDPSKNHQIMEIGGACSIRLFTITCHVHCEEVDFRFMHEQEDSRILFQDFTTGKVIDENLPDYLAEHLPE